VTVEELAEIQALSPEQAAIEWRRGAFGWPWIAAAHPVLRGEQGAWHALLPGGDLVPLDRPGSSPPAALDDPT